MVPGFWRRRSTGLSIGKLGGAGHQCLDAGRGGGAGGSGAATRCVAVDAAEKCSDHDHPRGAGASGAGFSGQDTRLRGQKEKTRYGRAPTWRRRRHYRRRSPLRPRSELEMPTCTGAIAGVDAQVPGASGAFGHCRTPKGNGNIGDTQWSDGMCTCITHQLAPFVTVGYLWSAQVRVHLTRSPL